MFNPLFCWHFRQRWSWHCLRQVLQGVLPQYHRPRFVSVKLSLSSSARNCHWTIVTSCNVSAPGDSDIISTTPGTQWVKSQELRLSPVEMRYRAQTSAASPIAISFLSFSYVILLSCVHLPYCDTDNTSYGCYVRHIHLVWWDRYIYSIGACWCGSDQISLCVDELLGDAVCLDASLAKLGMIRWSPRLVLHLEVLLRWLYA